MVPSLRYPCSRILATQILRWPPEHAGRRQSERIGDKSGKMDKDLEGPKNDLIQVLASNSHLPAESRMNSGDEAIRKCSQLN